jgi:hypothetical protein
MSTNNKNPSDPLDLFTFVEVTYKAPDAVQRACNRLILEHKLDKYALPEGSIESNTRIRSTNRR